MNARQRLLQRLRQRLKRKMPRRRALAARHRRIWCEMLEPRLALAAPVAVNDGYSALETVVALNVSAPGVLANDRDADGDLLSALIVAGPRRGTLSLGASGAFTYRPHAYYFQGDSFTYRVSDGALQSNPATVFLFVDCDCNPPVGTVNIPPVATNDSYTTPEDNLLSINSPGVLLNDTDFDGISLTAALVVGPTRGTLVLNPNGAFQYAPALNFHGADSFTYRASDATLASNVATVSITVQAVSEVPSSSDKHFAGSEDTVLNVAAPGVLAGDSDPDGDPLIALLVTPPTHGTLTLNANGSFTYIPFANYNSSQSSGPDRFTYRASDGTLTGNVTAVNITIAAVNDVHVANPNTYQTLQGQTLTIPAPGVLNNDTDVDNQVLTSVLASGPANGTLSLNANGGFQYAPNPGGPCSFPFVGIDSFTYRASDGAAQSSLATVTISVTGLGDPPIPIGIPIALPEDTSLTREAPGLLNITVPPGPCAPPGTPPAVYTFSGPASLVTPPQRGQMTVNANGSFSYIPQANFNGNDNFTFRAFDAQQQPVNVLATMVVTPVNDAPIANNDAFSGTEDVQLHVNAPGVLANDFDADSPAPTATLVTGPRGILTLNPNGSFVYTPLINFAGIDSFTYRASDGTLTSNLATVTITVAGCNDAPFAGNDNYSLNEDSVLTVAAALGVLANDSDSCGHGNPLTATLAFGPAHGTLQLSANGSFTYTPSANFWSPDSFSYRANNGTLATNLAIVTLNVQAVPDAPVANHDSYISNSNVQLTVAAPGVLANDTDVDSSTLVATLVTAPASGTLTLNPSGGFSYVPSSTFTGTVSFTYRANDGALISNLATVILNIDLPLPSQPVAVGDVFDATEDTPLVRAAPGVLANDSDSDGDTLLAILVQPTARGTLSLAANGGFTYTPSANVFGADSFTYRVSDGLLVSNVATVTIAVAPVNDAPVAANNAYTTVEDVPLVIAAGGVLVNDTDVDSNSLTAQLVAGPRNGVLTLQSSGGFTYTPHPNFFGLDSFTYRASDGLLSSNTSTVSINVTTCGSCTPVSINDTYNTNEDTTLTVASPGILTNDFDFDGDLLLAVLVAGPARGALSLSAAGGFTYTPHPHFFGADSFTYRANDGTISTNVATVTINVANIPDPPLAVNDVYSVAENTPRTISAANGVLANDFDADGDTLTALLVTGPARGTIFLNADGSFTYTPNLNFSGLDSFTYRARDAFVDGNQATVSLNVVGCNGCIPIAINDAYTAQRNTVLNIAAPGVLTNDAHSGGATLTAILVVSPAHGTLTLNANGSFRYTPNTNFTGTDSFTYRNSDGTTQSTVATVTITVTQPPNSPPLATNDHFTVLQNTPVTIPAPGVLVNDSDIDGDSLTAVLVSPPVTGTLTLNSNGSFSYTPAVNFTDAVSFTYRASDGISTSNLATVTLTICGACGVPPFASNDTYTVAEDTLLNVPVAGVLANDVDFSLNTLFAQLATGPARGTLILNANGSFLYTPQPNDNGADSFTYRAHNGQLTSNFATVTITVTPVNDAPVATPDAYTILRNTPLTIAPPGVLANDLDVDGDALTAALVFFDLPAHGTLLLATNGSFTFTPNAGFMGLDSFTYRASDGLVSSNPATVTINILPPCLECPTANDFYTLSEDVPLNVPAPGVLANDFDPDSDTLLAQLVTGPARGTLSLGLFGGFVYTPNANFNGVDSFTYRASVGQAIGILATVTLTVTPVNDVPVATPDFFGLICGVGTIGAPGVLGNDTDVDGNTLTAVLVSGPAQGTLTLNANGSFTFAAAPNFIGLNSFSYRASDGLANSNSATVFLVASAAQNMPPVAFDDNFTVTRNGLLLVAAPGVLANDNDDCGVANLSAQLVSGPAHGTLTLESSGSFQYTPSPGFEGTDSFSYRSIDGHFRSNSAVVTIAVVNENNQPPIAVGDRYTTARNFELSIGGLGILGNDLDPEGRPLTAALVAGPANGTLSLSSAGGFTYMPAQNFSGVDSFTYRASDGVASSGIATVTIAVAAPGANTPPVANHDQFYAIEDNAVSVFPGVLGNDTDAERNPLTAALVEGPAHGTLSLSAAGSFHYQPEADYYGLDRFTYRASDGSLTSDIATVSIFVFNINDRPVATDDNYTLAEDTLLNIAAPGVLANDSDRDGDPLTAALVAGPAHGTLSLAANGAFAYAHTPNFLGSDSFTYRASDGALTSNVATVSLRVGVENVPPSFVKGPDQTANDESGPQTIVNWATQISAGPPSEINQTLTFLVTATNGHLFAVPPQVTPAGRLTFTPALMASGTSVVTVRLQDSGGGDNTSPPQTFAITIARLRPLHNVRDPLDTNADGFISPIDAVLVINLFGGAGSAAAGEISVPTGLYPDVDGDNFVSPIDAVLVINALNSRPVAAPAAEGELPSAADLSDPTATSIEDDELDSLLLANDVESTRRRRSR